MAILPSRDERTRAFKAFLIVPLGLLPLGLVCWIFAIVAPSNSLVGLTPWLVLSPLAAYPMIWFIGFPLWLAIRRFIFPTLFVCIAGGLVGATLSGIVLIALIAPAHLSILDIFGRRSYATEAAVFALLGAVYGALFWALTYDRSEKAGLG